MSINPNCGLPLLSRTPHTSLNVELALFGDILSDFCLSHAVGLGKEAVLMPSSLEFFPVADVHSIGPTLLLVPAVDIALYQK